MILVNIGAPDQGNAASPRSDQGINTARTTTRENHMMSEDVRQKIIDIICEEWPTPDGYLLGFDIYERLRSQGVEVTHEAVESVLSGLAASGRITLSLADGDGPPPGGAVIDEVEEDLCE
jgi:hypothetical protein